MRCGYYTTQGPCRLGLGHRGAHNSRLGTIESEAGQEQRQVDSLANTLVGSIGSNMAFVDKTIVKVIQDPMRILFEFTDGTRALIEGQFNITIEDSGLSRAMQDENAKQAEMEGGPDPIIEAGNELMRGARAKIQCSCINIKHKRRCTLQALLICKECGEALCRACANLHHAHDDFDDMTTHTRSFPTATGASTQIPSHVEYPQDPPTVEGTEIEKPL